MSRMTALLLTTTLLAVSPAFHLSAQEVGEAAAVSEVVPPAITVSTVAPHTLRDRIIASGLVAAVDEVQVQPLIEGQPIETMLADVGDIVAEGQVLAVLSRASLDLQMSQLEAQRAAIAAQVAQAEANLIEASASAAEAQRVADRNETLVEQGTISRANADQTLAAAEAATARRRAAEQGVIAAAAQSELLDAQVATLELQLSRTEVRAPVAGIVVGRNAQMGAIASAAGAPLFTIVRDSALEMQAEVAEQDLLRLAPGQRVAMTSIGSAEPIIGTVRLVEPSINITTRLGSARISIEDPSMVRIGMFLTADIRVSESELLAVPVTAVNGGPDGASVMRVRDGVAELVIVTTGIRDGNLIGITSGLEPGDLVVTKAAAFVRDGDRITPVPDTTIPASEG